MRKRIVALITALVLVFAATNVYGILADDDTGKKLIKRGYTEKDLIEIDAIFLLSDVGVTAFITQKYEELGDWEKVREYFGVDEKEYQEYVEGRARWQEVMDEVPEKIMTEMKDKLSLMEVNLFISKIHAADVDYSIAWDKYKSGKTADEIVAEKWEQNKKLSEILKKFINGKITLKEYESEITVVVENDKKTIEKLMNEAEEAKTRVHNQRKELSGITKEEMIYCFKRGLTNPIDMYQAKYFSKGNNIPFKKVVEARLKYGDWITTASALLNIPLDDYRQGVQNAINN